MMGPKNKKQEAGMRNIKTGMGDNGRDDPRYSGPHPRDCPICSGRSVHGNSVPSLLYLSEKAEQLEVISTKCPFESVYIILTADE